MIVVDVETTGLDPLKNSIVSIGAVDFFNPLNQFYGECKIWDGAEITQQALNVNGFSVDEITSMSKQSLKDLIQYFIDWAAHINPKVLAGHNTYFDVSFLEDSAKKYQIPWIFGWRLIDLHSEGFTNHIKNNFKLPLNEGMPRLTADYLHNYTGLPSEPKPHNALTGAKMEAETFSRLIYGKGLLKDYEGYLVPKYLR